MKKFLLCLLALVLVLSMTACKTTTENPDEIVEGEVAGNETASVAETLKGIFAANVSADATAEEIANVIIEKAALPIAPMAMTIEEGFLTGFDNAEITGFEDGAVFMPMIGSIPFVGYIFKLPADADVEGFKTTLTENANLRWNICVTADEMAVANEGNIVFFVMCPASFDEPEAEDDMPEMLEDGLVDDGLVDDGLVDEVAEDEIVEGETVEDETVEVEVAEETFAGEFVTVDSSADVSLDNEISADFSFDE